MNNLFFAYISKNICKSSKRFTGFDVCKRKVQQLAEVVSVWYYRTHTNSIYISKKLLKILVIQQLFFLFYNTIWMSGLVSGLQNRLYQEIGHVSSNLTIVSNNHKFGMRSNLEWNLKSLIILRLWLFLWKVGGVGLTHQSWKLAIINLVQPFESVTFRKNFNKK